MKLQVIHGFAVETTAATVIQAASFWEFRCPRRMSFRRPFSVRATWRLNAVKWGIVGQMVWAWVLTVPVTAVIGYLTE